MKRTKKITSLNVSAVIQIDELFLEEAEAFALIKAVDIGQADVGFTEKVIVDLIKDLQGEFKNNPEEFEDFKQNIIKALEFK